MTTVDSCFVLVSDDVLLARALAAAISGTAALHVVSSAEQALALLNSTRSISGIVLDQAALGADTLRIVNKLRTARPLASLLFVASKLEVSLINSLQPMRVQLLVRPLPADGLAQYVMRALSNGRVTSADMQLWVARLSSDRRLSAGDRALIPLILETESPELACHRLGIDRGALERGLRRIVKKCRVRNTDRLARNLWRDALLFSREDASEWIDSPKMSAAV